MLIDMLVAVESEKAGVGGTVVLALIESCGLAAFAFGFGCGAADAAPEAGASDAAVASRVVDIMSRRLRALSHCFVCFITSCCRPNRLAICSSRSLGIAMARVFAAKYTRKHAVRVQNTNALL